MKRLTTICTMLLIISLLFICHLSHAQERDLVREMTDNYIQVRQKPGTEKLLREYLSGLESDADTIYAVAYRPANCPRCEAYIPGFFRIMNETDSRQETLLITVYKEKTASERYNRKNGFEAKHYLYDTTNTFHDIFDVNLGSISGTVIMKLKRSTGEMLTGGEATEMSHKFVRQLIAYRGKLEPMTFGSNTQTDDKATMEARKPTAGLIGNSYDDYPLITGEHPISAIYGTPKFEHGTFVFNDKLAEGIMMFEEKDGKLNFRTLLQADSTEQDRFVEIDRKTLQQMKRRHMVFYIPCDPQIMPNGDIAMSYSLPHIIWDTIYANGSTAYYNSPAILRRKATTLERLPMIAPDFMLDRDTMFFYNVFSFSIFKDNLIAGSKKLTWPMEYDREDYEHIMDKNPFADGFYDTSNPTLAIFGTADGKLRRHIGDMEACHRKSRTGYWFVRPVSYSTADEMIYSDGFSGKVHIIRDVNDDSPESYSAFDVETELFPTPDTTAFYRYEYVKPYYRLYDRLITAVRMDRKNIYCLICYSAGRVDNPATDTYTLVTISRKSGRRTEVVLPHFEEMEAVAYGLNTSKDGHIHPFCMYRTDGGFVVRVFKKK